MIILRLRLCVPVPQVRVHSLQPAHTDVLQCTGQFPSEHVCDSVVDGQAIPPWAADVVMARLRVCAPVPQDTVHASQLFHLLTSQSTEQGVTAHSCTALTTGHTVPPRLASVVIERVRTCVPPPHVLLQMLQRSHSETAQSTGHGTSEHARASASSGHT